VSRTFLCLSRARWRACRTAPSPRLFSINGDSRHFDMQFGSMYSERCSHHGVRRSRECIAADDGQNSRMDIVRVLAIIMTIAFVHTLHSTPKARWLDFIKKLKQVQRTYNLRVGFSDQYCMASIMIPEYGGCFTITNDCINSSIILVDFHVCSVLC